MGSSEMVRLLLLVETCWFPSSVLKMKTEKFISKFLSLYNSAHGVTFRKRVSVVVYTLRKNEVATGNARRDRYSSAGIATRYGLDGQGIESRCGRDFPHPSRPTLGPTQLLYSGYRVFPGLKRSGRVVVHPPHPVPR